MSAAEDGPIFRATMKSLESKTGSMRARMKQVLKKAEAAKYAQVACNQSVAAFMEALQEASSSIANAVKPALDHYFEKIAKAILRYEIQNAENLQKLIIDPVGRLYSNDIKQAESKKKDFEDESKDYYAYMSRYLGQRQDSLKDKKRAESDTKYQNKRRTFELKRFDYSSFMQDLHGGRKDQEVLSQLTKYADTQAKGYLDTARKIEALLPQLEALRFEVKEADKQYQLLRTGREEKRRALEKNNRGAVETEAASTSGESSLGQHNHVGNRAVGLAEYERSTPSLAPAPTRHERPLSDVPLLATSTLLETSVDASTSTSSKANASRLVNMPSANQLQSSRHVEPKGGSDAVRAEQHRKEGLLWSLSKPGSHADPRGLNKQAWHK